MDTNVSLDEVQYELSALSHNESLNVLTNVRNRFKQNIYTPGVCKNKTHGGVFVDANVLMCWGNEIVGVDHSVWQGGGGNLPRGGVGVAMPHLRYPFTRTPCV